eukprot:3243214-Pyramimonas_sp.AAC.1
MFQAVSTESQSLTRSRPSSLSSPHKFADWVVYPPGKSQTRPSEQEPPSHPCDSSKLLRRVCAARREP